MEMSGANEPSKLADFAAMDNGSSLMTMPVAGSNVSGAFGARFRFHHAI